MAAELGAPGARGRFGAVAGRRRFRSRGDRRPRPAASCPVRADAATAPEDRPRGLPRKDCLGRRPRRTVPEDRPGGLRRRTAAEDCGGGLRRRTAAARALSGCATPSRKSGRGRRRPGSACGTGHCRSARSRARPGRRDRAAPAAPRRPAGRSRWGRRLRPRTRTGRRRRRRRRRWPPPAPRRCAARRAAGDRAGPVRSSAVPGGGSGPKSDAPGVLRSSCAAAGPAGRTAAAASSRVAGSQRDGTAATREGESRSGEGHRSPAPMVRADRTVRPNRCRIEYRPVAATVVAAGTAATVRRLPFGRDEVTRAQARRRRPGTPPAGPPPPAPGVSRPATTAASWPGRAARTGACRRNRSTRVSRIFLPHPGTRLVGPAGGQAALGGMRLAPPADRLPH